MKWPGAELSVTTPLRIALLGLRVGDRMPYRLGDRAPEHEVRRRGLAVPLGHELARRSPMVSFGAVPHDGSAISHHPD
jgi:hypothetical protein